MAVITQVKDRDSHIQQLNVHLAQEQANKQVSNAHSVHPDPSLTPVTLQSYHDHTLRGQIQELTMRKNALEGEVARAKERNDQLLSKTKEMQQSREVMIQKLERLESMSPVSSAPSLALRTTSDGDERERLQEEVTSLRAERDRANRDKLAVDEMFQGSNRKSQNLTEELFALQSEVSQLKGQLSEQEENAKEMTVQRSLQTEASQDVQRMREECDRLRGEARNMVAEKKSLDMRVSGLARERDASMEEVRLLQQSREEVRKMNRKYESDISLLEEKLSMGNSAEYTASLHSMKLSSISSTLPKKLNDAKGRIKDLEAVSAIKG